MVKLDNNFNQNNPLPNSSATNQFNSQTQQPEQTPNKGLIAIPQNIMNMLPWIPFAIEAISGQKVPQMSGTMAEIQGAIQQIQFNLSQVLTNQQQLWTKMEALEMNATNQFTNLATQVQSIQSLRLTHSKEHKAIEYNAPKPSLEENY